ncbi:EpsG family protein [Prevotella sp.]|uniref:EpsG family protein n=1 Tax=Prevotella sp. TaxID=59823 RepID=UPI0025DD612F|nr:EpsG family protein [Prevotella sp.]
MIYLIFVLISIYGIVKYDFPMSYKIYGSIAGKSKFSPRFLGNRKMLIYVLLVYMVLFTGFSFRVGTDIGRYMYDFDYIQWSELDLTKLSFSYRQPFWILIQLLSKSVVNSFVVFRLLTSLIVTGVIFFLFKKETPFVFTAILFYFLMMSFDMNFNILRQSLAIACFVPSCIFLKKRKWLKGIGLIFASFLFHNSAFVLFMVPLLMFINVKEKFNIGFLFLSIFCLSLLYLPKDNFLFAMLLYSNDDSLSSLSDIYLSDEYGSAAFSLFKVMIHLTIFYFIAKKYKESGASNLDLVLLYLYIVCFISSASIPIVGRIKYYFTIFYILSVSKSVFYFINKQLRNIIISRKITINVQRCKIFVWVMIICVLLFQPVTYYFTFNPRLNAPNIIQYYPYYSVFNPQVSPERNKLVDY